MSAVVKRFIRLASLKGELITNPRAMFDVAERNLTTEKLRFFYVPKKEVDLVRQAVVDVTRWSKQSLELRRCMDLSP